MHFEVYEIRCGFFFTAFTFHLFINNAWVQTAMFRCHFMQLGCQRHLKTELWVTVVSPLVGRQWFLYKKTNWGLWTGYIWTGVSLWILVPFFFLFRQTDWEINRKDPTALLVCTSKAVPHNAVPEKLPWKFLQIQILRSYGVGCWTGLVSWRKCHLSWLRNLPF